MKSEFTHKHHYKALFIITLGIVFGWTNLIWSQAQTVTFNYTGAMQTWVVPPCVNTITVVAAGAKGGGSNGGNGARITGTLTVTPGQTLNIFVGGMGFQGNNSGGFNGGGTGRASSGSAVYSSFGGGGASDIRIGGVALANRVCVAGGGGGRSGGSSPVCGGAANCNNGAAGCSTFGAGGGGGTQTAGGAGGAPWAGTPPGGAAGALGVGGGGGLWQTASGGGGGGGYYGGGGGGNDGCCTGANGGGGGGGGSSLLPAGWTCLPANNTGNGYVTITFTPGFVATASNTGPYCPGATIQLNSLPANLPVGTTYSWTGPSGFTSTLANPTVSNAATTNSGNYAVTITAPGCTASANTNVVVNPTPAVDAGLDQTVCQNIQVTLTATGTTTYSWNPAVTNGTAFTPPLGSTTYTVTGTSLGCSATDQVVVTVNENPTVNAGLDQTICAGQPVTLTATTTLAANLSWDNGVVDGVAFNPAATATYTASVTSAQNCTASDAVLVTVNPLPLVNAGLDQTVCENTPVTLTATGASTYVWTGGVTNGVAFTQPVSAVMYTVTGTSALNCTALDSVLVTVNPNPVPVITGPTTYCVNNPPTLSTTTTFSSYAWTTGVNTATTVATAANNPITVQVTNGFGCSATSPPFSLIELQTITTNSTESVCQGESILIHGTPQSTAGLYTGNFTSILGCDSISNVTLTILPLPNVNAGSDVEVCETVPVTLTASGAITYTWTGGITNGNAFVQPPGTVSYTVTGVDANNCENTDVVEVIVNAFPVVDAGADQSICPGDPVTLNGSGAVSYVWNLGVTDGVVFNPIATQLYTVTGTDANGCVDTDQVTVTVNPNPTVSAGSDQTICEGEMATLNGSGAQSYTWTNGVSDGVPFTPAIIGSNTYTVTGTSQFGCTNTDNVTVIVVALPTVNFISNVETGCVPLMVNFTNTGASGTDCVWNFGDGNAASGCGGSSNLFSQIGCYDVTLTVTNSTGCVNSATINNMICVEGPPNPNFTATPNVISEYNSTVNFINNTTNAATYLWDFGDNIGTSTSFEPAYTYDPSVNSNYTVTLFAYSPLGCMDSTTGFIQYQEEVIYYIPNSFTPDGDMHNQTFQPVFTSGYDPYNFVMYIYNRWGELIFETHDASIGWDGTYGGKLVQDGSYTWKIEFKAPNNDKKYVDSGNVSIMK